MRVLQIIPKVIPGGGAEQSLVMMAPHLIERGIDLHLAVMRPEQPLRPELERSGVVYHDLSGARTLVPGWPIRIRALIRSLRPAVVHSTLLSAEVSTRLASLGTGVTVLTTWANTTYSPTRRELEPGIGTWKTEVMRLIDMTTAHLARSYYHAVTEGVAEDGVAALHVRRDRVTVVERGRDLSHFVPATDEGRVKARAAMGVGEEDRVLLCVARQFHQKGHVHLLAAFDRLASDRPDLRLVMVGPEGPATPVVREALSSTVHRDRVTDLGERFDVPALLGGADVFVLPSVAEGAAGSILEAMAAEVPVVACRLEGLRGVIEDGSHALLVRPGDPADLARGIAATLDDPEATRRRVATARSHVIARFSIERCADGMAVMYRTLGSSSR